MNQTITTEELLALSKSADLLRQTAERAMKADSYERELHRLREERRRLINDRDLIARQRDRMAQDRDAWEDAANHNQATHQKLEQRVNELLRENETLARNLPPEPPAFRSAFFEAKEELAEKAREAFTVGTPYEVKMTDKEQIGDWNRIATTKVIGQAWCKTDRHHPTSPELVNHANGLRMVLCEVRRDMRTGALTYHPIQIENLPTVQ